MRALIDLPEIEYLDGQTYPKVSPKATHSIVQGNVYRILWRCAAGRGGIFPELHVYPGRIDDTKTVFVPDVAYVSWDRLRALPEEEREEPPSPEVAVEVRPPSVDVHYLARKIERYLATGTLLVLDVDPRTRTIVAHDPARVRIFEAGEAFEHDDVPWLRFDVDEAFADLDKL